MGKTSPQGYTFPMTNETNQTQTKNLAKQTVLVGMTGKISSSVTAYLLKKQGYRVIGVCVLWFDDPAQIQNYPQWHIPDINEVKKVCDQLDIEFYGVQGKDVFQAYIEEPYLSARLMGKAFALNCSFHQALFRVLQEKSLKVKADFISTGHFAKITKNQSTQKYNLMTANDLKNDQSHLLARLDQSMLARLDLPLAEVSAVQVKKLGDALGLVDTAKVKKSLRYETREMAAFDEYFRTRVANTFLKEGQIVNWIDQEVLGEHSGIHLYTLGQTSVVGKDNLQLDAHLQIINIDTNAHAVYVVKDTEFQIDHLLLDQVRLDPELNLARPIELFVKVNGDERKFQGLMMVKNSFKAMIELKEKLSFFLPPGEQVCLYQKEGSSSKVLGFGVIQKAGCFHPLGSFLPTIPSKPQKDGPDEDEYEDPQVAKERKQREDQLKTGILF